MANFGMEFDVEDLPEGNGNFEPLPPGWYSATITRADLMCTKAGTGKFIKVRYDITGPTHEGRVVFGNINIENQNPIAEEIGRQNLGDLMRAAGLKKVRDTDQLIGANMKIKLSVKPAQDGYDAGNEVKGWKALDGGTMGAAMGSPKPAAAKSERTAPASGGANPPWRK